MIDDPTGTGKSALPPSARAPLTGATQLLGFVLDIRAMTFDHERLDVYRVSLDFLVFAHEIIAKLPKGRAYFADQLGRAALSIVLNIAEGAGKTSSADKRRFYVTARGSATESAALLDALQRLAVLAGPEQRTGKEMLFRIVSMLVKLARSREPDSQGPTSPE